MNVNALPDYLKDRLIEAVRNDMRRETEAMHHDDDKLLHGWRIRANIQILEALNPKSPH